MTRYFLHAADHITVTTELYKHCHASIVNLRVTEPLPPGRRPKGIVDACHYLLYVPRVLLQTEHFSFSFFLWLCYCMSIFVPFKMQTFLLWINMHFLGFSYVEVVYFVPSMIFIFYFFYIF
jgi:hypothetical protein